MRIPLTILIVLASLSVVGGAQAGDDCTVPMAQWQPRQAVQQLAEVQGWTVRRIKIDDGCYEINGQDAAGRAFKAKVDPGTLAIIQTRFKD
ncbi:MAG TPA: PepSY domain-containing protein [Devosia sp.]|nr:PepSY domain-containing protein [Devosia sp.]